MPDLTIAAILEYYGADLTRVQEYGWRSLKCPFHNDRIASARVNLESGGFACLGCGAHGDALALVARREGFGTETNPDRMAAIEWAEKTLGASVPDVRRSAKAARARQARKRRAWRHSLFD